MTLFDLRIINPTFPDEYGDYLTEWSALTASVDRMAPGSLNFTYRKNGENEAAMRASQVVAFLQDGKEGDNCRFILRNRAGNRINPDGAEQPYQFASVLDALKDATFRAPAAQKTRTWVNQTVGYQLLEVIHQPEDRGAYTWWGYQGVTFTRTHDTNGVEWPTIARMEHEYGQSVFDIVDYLVQNRWCELSTTRGKINAYVPEARGFDWSNIHILKQGVDLQDAPEQETWDDFVSDLTVIGGETDLVDSTGNSTGTAPRVYAYVTSGVETWGRREKKITVTGVQNLATLEQIGRQYLRNFTGPRNSRTYKVSTTDPVVSDSVTTPFDLPAEPRPVPMVDYTAADFIGVSFTDGQPVKKDQVEVISVTTSERNAGEYLITVNDWLDDRDIRLDRLLNKYGL